MFDVRCFHGDFAGQIFGHYQSKVHIFEPRRALSRGIAERLKECRRIVVQILSESVQRWSRHGIFLTHTDGGKGRNFAQGEADDIAIAGNRTHIRPALSPARGNLGRLLVRYDYHLMMDQAFLSHLLRDHNLRCFPNI